MKIIIASLLVLSLNTAVAGKILDCKEAAGYYANIELHQKGSAVSLIAAQGFSFEISGQLGLTESAELRIHFSKSECAVLSRTLIKCSADSARVESVNFNGTKKSFKGSLKLHVEKIGGSSTVVSVSLLKDGKLGSEIRTIDELPGGSHCKFNL